MEGLSLEMRRDFGKKLETTPQHIIMEQIPQFSQAQIYNIAPMPEIKGNELGALVFNMERGIYLDETVDFLKNCPDIQPCDLILANELDDGNLRSGSRDVAGEIARRMNMNYVFSLEFIELANEDDPKGLHGNAIFSRWPITWAKTLRLPEEYNWFFDRQRRIGGRNAVMAKIDVNGREVGAISAHLENRTNADGRARQMKVILDAADRYFKGIPVILGGDFNTNTFDGRDKETIGILADDLRRLCDQMKNVVSIEYLLSDCRERGFEFDESFGAQMPTRRKPLPNGKDLPLLLDWLMVRGLSADDCRVIATDSEGFSFALPGSPLSLFKGKEISDHNAVWAKCKI